MAGAKRLIESGAIPRDESIVVLVTGNGYKTADVMRERVGESVRVGRGLRDFEAVMGGALPAIARV